MQFMIQNGFGLAGFFLAMLGMLELGRRIGRRRVQTDPKWDSRGVNTIENTLLALLGLLLAFTFSGAWSRFDARRELILRETNAIGTAWLPLDLVTPAARERMRASFRQYVERRIADAKESTAKPTAEVVGLQQAIWSEAVVEARGATDGRVAQTLLPALNKMFDVATARYQSVVTHPPFLVYLLLLANALVACLLAGYGMAAGSGRNWLHIFCFTGSLLLVIYVTVDLEFPRRGLIRVDNYDQLLVDLRTGMK